MMLSFRLNPDIDEEIIEKVEKIPKRDRSRTYREALRQYFFGGNASLNNAPSLKLDLSEEDKKKGNENNLDDVLNSTLNLFD